jgi:hypothetical protein
LQRQAFSPGIVARAGLQPALGAPPPPCHKAQVLVPPHPLPEPHLAAALVGLRWVVVGLGWQWLGARPGEPAAARWARLLAYGWLGHALLGLTLALAGGFTRPALWLGALALSALGASLGARWAADALPPRCGDAGFAAAFALALGLSGGSLPSDWLAGGRDPGLYLGEGVRLARTGTLRPPPVSAFAPESADLFLQHRYGFPEIQPVVPHDPATRRDTPYFFPLTPSLIGQLALDGGLPLARAFPALLGLTCLALFGLTLAAGGMRWAAAALAGLALLAQPVFLHQLTLPMSELVELLAVLAAVLAWRAGGQAGAALAALALLAGVTNRFSFVFFGGALLGFQLWAEHRRLDRPARLRLWGWAVAGLAAGAAWCLSTAAPALLRLDDQARELAVGAAVAAAAALALASWPRLPDRWARLPGEAWLLPAGLLLLALAAARGGLGRTAFACSGAWAFVGPVALVLGLAGLAARMIRPTPPEERGPLDVLLPYFALTALIILTRFEIAPDFPWAARRYLLGLAPAAALGVVAVGQALASHPRAAAWRGWPAAALTVAVALAGLNLVRALPEGLRFEYRRLADQLTAIDRHVSATDVVIADHFVWGTPLRLVFGREVLDGEWLRQRGAMAEGLAAARQGLPEGGRLLLLTSVGPGADWADWAAAHARPLAEWRWAYAQARAHRNLRALRYEEKEKWFRLWEVPPP